MKFLLETSCFDSGFLAGVVGRPAEGDEITGLLTAGAGVPTAAVGFAPTGVPTVGLEPTGVPIVGLETGDPTLVAFAGC